MLHISILFYFLSDEIDDYYGYGDYHDYWVDHEDYENHDEDYFESQGKFKRFIVILGSTPPAGLRLS